MKRAIRLTGTGGAALAAAIAGALSPLVHYGMVHIDLVPEADGARLEIEGGEQYVEEAMRLAEAMVKRIGERADVVPATPGAVGEA